MNLIATLRTSFLLAALLAVAAGALRPAAAQTPNDPLYPQQTYLETIDAESAWAVTTGDAGQKIAIIGTGSALPTHEDLDAKVSIESRGTYDDENFGADDPLPYQFQPTPGTATAGIAAALTNNGMGIAGTNWNASILSYDPTTYEGPLNPDGSPAGAFYAVLNLGAVDRDLDDAVDAGADFLLTNFSVFIDDDPPEPEIDWEAGVKFKTDLDNYSESGFYFNFADYAESVGRTLFNYLKDKFKTHPDYVNAKYALRDAARAGRTIVAPIGDYTGTRAVGLPARYSSNGMVITVGASDGNGLPYDYSVASDDDLDFVAPGVNIMTTVNDGPSAYREITSSGASAALMTGAASLLQAAAPSMKREDLRQVLRRTAVDIGDPGRDAETGYGRIDVGAAMDYVQERTFTRGIATNGDVTRIEEDYEFNLLRGPWWSGNTLATANYYSDLYKVTFDISFPTGADQDLWVRPNQTVGWSDQFGQNQDRWAKVTNVDPYTGTATLVTYVFGRDIYDLRGRRVYGNLPTSPEDAQVAYTVATKPGSLPLSLTVDCGQDSNGDGISNCIAGAQGGGGNYEYDWSINNCDGSATCAAACGGYLASVTVSSANGDAETASTTTGRCLGDGCPGDEFPTPIICEGPGLQSYATTDEDEVQSAIDATASSLQPVEDNNSAEPPVSSARAAATSAKKPAPGTQAWLKEASTDQKLQRLYSLLVLKARIKRMRDRNQSKAYLHTFAGSNAELRSIFTGYAEASAHRNESNAAKDAAHQILVEDLVRNGQPVQALRTARRYAAGGASSKEARARLHLARAAAFQHEGKFKQALKAVDAAEKQWPERSGYDAIRVMLLRQGGDPRWKKVAAQGADSLPGMTAETQSTLPEDFMLEAPYPNPAGDGRVTIPLALPERAEVRAAAYDVLGRRVEVLSSKSLAAGRPKLTLSTDDLSSGLYLIRVEVKAASGETRTFTEEITVVR